MEKNNYEEVLEYFKTKISTKTIKAIKEIVERDIEDINPGCFLLDPEFWN